MKNAKKETLVKELWIILRSMLKQKLPKVKESQIQTSIEQFLKLQENLGKLIYIKNNSGSFKTEMGGYYRMGKRGSPDFIVWLTLGQYLETYFIEVKSPTNKYGLSVAQREFKEQVEKMCGRFFVVRGVEEVQKILQL